MKFKTHYIVSFSYPMYIAVDMCSAGTLLQSRPGCLLSWLRGFHCYP